MRSIFSFRLPVRIRCLALAALAALALGAPAVSFGRPMPQPQQTPPKSARPLPPPQYIPGRNYDTRHIRLDLHFDWEHTQAIGTATISFAPLTKDVQRVEFDAANMTFNFVKLANGTQLKFEADAAAQKLRVTLDHPYQPTDEVTLVVDYHTNGPVPNQSVNGGGGLTFITPTKDDPTRPRQIWSQGESEYNHYWFPCFDHPNDFFTSEIVATVEKPLSVISNGQLVETKDNGDGTRTFHWKIDAPHASYLTSIVVGEYTAVEGSYAGIPVITNVYPQEIEDGRVTAARLPEMVKFFSEKTGVKYPYAKYAQTVARDFNGGMENISATTQTDLMIHDARAELDQTSDGLESHELAHQWFGDYLTCRSWSDIWLNESFATYFQAMWDEHHLGRDDFLYLDVKGNQEQYYAAWAQGLRRPIVTRNYANPDAVFDTYAYPRGGAVLHMLRQAIGEDNWWRSINHYLTKYAHQPVETEQFRIAIEETTGQPMDWFFDEWVYRMGHPVFRVTQTFDPTTKTLALSVRQEQKPDPDSQYPQAGFFRTPVEIEVGTASRSRVERFQIEPKEEQTFSIPVESEPLLVNFDYGDTLIKELRFEKTSAQLLYQLAHDEDVTGRLWALAQLKDRLKTDSTAATEKQQLTTAIAAALRNDKFWGTREEAAAALSGITDEAARTALLAAARDPKSGVRARAITSLASTNDPKLASVYLQALGDPSYAVIHAAAVALGKTKDPGAYDALVKLISAPSWRDNVRASALSGLAALGDARALELGFRYAATGNPPGVRGAAFSLLAAAGKKDPRVFPLISETLTQSVMGSKFQFIVASAEALVALCDPKGMATLEELGKNSKTNPLILGFLEQVKTRLGQCVQTATPAPVRTP